MNSYKQTTICRKFLDHIQSFQLRLFHIYNENEAFYVDNEDRVYGYLNSGRKPIKELSGQNVIHFSHLMVKTQGKRNYCFFAVTPKAIYCSGFNYNKLFYNQPDQVQGWKRLDINIDKNETFVKLSCNQNFCMVLTSKNNVILWGNNKYGQIGTSQMSNYENPYKISFKGKETVVKKNWFRRFLGRFTKKKNHLKKRIFEVDTVETSTILDITTNKTNSFVLLKNGSVYAWGHISCMGINNIAEKDDLVHTNNCVVRPYPILGDTIEIVASQHYMMSLRNDNVLFTTGDLSCQSLIEPNDMSHLKEPERLAEFEFKHIGVWNNLAMARSTDGKCFIWGDYNKKVNIKMVTIKEKIPFTKQEDIGVQANIQPEPQLKAITYYRDARLNDEENPEPGPSFTEKRETESEIYKGESEKNVKARRDLRAKAAIENGDYDTLEFGINITEPFEVNANSIDEIVSKHFDITYGTYDQVKYSKISGVNREVIAYGNGLNYQELIDLSDKYVVKIDSNYDVIEMLREVFRTIDEMEKKILEQQINEKDEVIRQKEIELSKNERMKDKIKIFNNYMGDFSHKSENSVFKNSNLTDVKGINIKENDLSGTRNCR